MVYKIEPWTCGKLSRDGPALRRGFLVSSWAEGSPRVDRGSEFHNTWRPVIFCRLAATNLAGTREGDDTTRDYGVRVVNRRDMTGGCWLNCCKLVKHSTGRASDAQAGCSLSLTAAGFSQTRGVYLLLGYAHPLEYELATMEYSVSPYDSRLLVCTRREAATWSNLQESQSQSQSQSHYGGPCRRREASGSVWEKGLFEGRRSQRAEQRPSPEAHGRIPGHPSRASACETRSEVPSAQPNSRRNETSGRWKTGFPSTGVQQGEAGGWRGPHGKSAQRGRRRSGLVWSKEKRRAWSRLRYLPGPIPIDEEP